MDTKPFSELVLMDIKWNDSYKWSGASDTKNKN